MAVCLGDGDGVFDRSDAAVDENVLGFAVRKEAWEFPNVGEALDLAVPNPVAEVLEVETGTEDRVLDVALLELHEPAEPIDG